jgi:hypothetical protein
MVIHSQEINDQNGYKRLFIQQEIHSNNMKGHSRWALQKTRKTLSCCKVLIIRVDFNSSYSALNSTI